MCSISRFANVWSQIKQMWVIFTHLKVIYHPLYGINNYVLIWGDWLSCDPLRGSHDSQSPHISIRSIRIQYVLYKLYYVPSSTVRTKRTVTEPEQSEKLPFGYKSRRISHSSMHFLITMKMAYPLTRETEMTVAGMGLVLCAAAALEIEEEEKKKEKKDNWAITRLCYTNWKNAAGGMT